MAKDPQWFEYPPIKVEATTTLGNYAYLAHVTQTGTSAPVATVIANSLSAAPVWSYVSVGVYRLTLAGAFPAAKTSWSAINKDLNLIGVSRVSDNILQFVMGADAIMDAQIQIVVQA
jgi:hypothetical protein